MLWTGQICVSDRERLDTAISDEVLEMCGIHEEREALTKAIEEWLRHATVKIADIPQTQWKFRSYEIFEASFLAPKLPMPPIRKKKTA